MPLRLSSPAFRPVLLVGFGQMLAWGSSFYLIAVLAHPMAAQFGISALTVYAMFSLGLIVSALAGPAIGSYIDRHGGRRALMLSNLLMAAAHLTLASATHPLQLGAGWVLLCVAMPFGLYEAAFATLLVLFGPAVRSPFTIVTLIAGLGSSMSWPLTAALEAEIGWRLACVFWALLHLSVGLWAHSRLPLRQPAPRPAAAADAPAAPAQTARMIWLALCFVSLGVMFSAMASHLPKLLQLTGLAPAVAVGTAALVGVAQIVGRLADMAFLRHWHPLPIARLAHGTLPVAGLLLLMVGAPFAAVFTILHGLCLGLLTITKGLLPLALFGAEGFGRRSAVLESPARMAVALTPFAFGYAIESWGLQALWLYVAVALLGAVSAWALKRPAEPTPG